MDGWMDGWLDGWMAGWLDRGWCVFCYGDISWDLMTRESVGIGKKFSTSRRWLVRGLVVWCVGCGKVGYRCHGSFCDFGGRLWGIPRGMGVTVLVGVRIGSMMGGVVALCGR